MSDAENNPIGHLWSELKRRRVMWVAVLYAIVLAWAFEKARSWADRALDTDLDEPAVLYNVACSYSLMGDSDRAIALLGEAIEAGFGYRAWLENDNTLENLRDDPRFQELVRRLA